MELLGTEVDRSFQSFVELFLVSLDLLAERCIDRFLSLDQSLHASSRLVRRKPRGKQILAGGSWIAVFGFVALLRVDGRCGGKRKDLWMMMCSVLV